MGNETYIPGDYLANALEADHVVPKGRAGKVIESIIDSLRRGLINHGKVPIGDAGILLLVAAGDGGFNVHFRPSRRFWSSVGRGVGRVAAGDPASVVRPMPGCTVCRQAIIEAAMNLCDALDSGREERAMDMLMSAVHWHRNREKHPA